MENSSNHQGKNPTVTLNLRELENKQTEMHTGKAKGREILPGSRKNSKRYENKPFVLNNELRI